MTATELLARRDELRTDLEAGRLHVLSVLRLPAPEMESVPVGDVLCWAGGLGEEGVTHVLLAADLTWGLRVGLLSTEEIDCLCKRIKRLYPEAWNGWRNR